MAHEQGKEIDEELAERQHFERIVTAYKYYKLVSFIYYCKQSTLLFINALITLFNLLSPTATLCLKSNYDK